MDTIFMNSENSKTSDPHRLLLNLSDKTELKRKDNYVALWLAFTIRGKIMNLKYRTGTEEFELHDGSNSVSDIQDYFKYLLKTWDSYC